MSCSFEYPKRKGCNVDWKCDAKCPKVQTCRVTAGSKVCTKMRATVSRRPLLRYKLNSDKTEMSVECAAGHETVLAEFRTKDRWPLDIQDVENWYGRHVAWGDPTWCPVCQPMFQGAIRTEKKTFDKGGFFFPAQGR